MGQVTIAGNSYDVMGDLPGAKLYLAAAVGAGPDAFNALVATPDLQSKLIVSATRMLKALDWEGTPTVATQDTAFPRNGVVDSDGVVVPDGTTPEDIVNAEYTLAGLLAADSSITTASGSGSNIQSLQAGAVSISYFRATIGVDAGETPMPPQIMRMIEKYLSRGGDTLVLTSGFTSCEARTSSFDDCAQYTRKGPFA